jgi:hypothetical protein
MMIMFDRVRRAPNVENDKRNSSEIDLAGGKNTENVWVDVKPRQIFKARQRFK